MNICRILKLRRKFDEAISQFPSIGKFYILNDFDELFGVKLNSWNHENNIHKKHQHFKTVIVISDVKNINCHGLKRGCQKYILILVQTNLVYDIVYIIWLFCGKIYPNIIESQKNWIYQRYYSLECIQSKTSVKATIYNRNLMFFDRKLQKIYNKKKNECKILRDKARNICLRYQMLMFKGQREKQDENLERQCKFTITSNQLQTSDYGSSSSLESTESLDSFETIDAGISDCFRGLSTNHNWHILKEVNTNPPRIKWDLDVSSIAHDAQLKPNLFYSVEGNIGLDAIPKCRMFLPYSQCIFSNYFNENFFRHNSVPDLFSRGFSRQVDMPFNSVNNLLNKSEYFVRKCNSMPTTFVYEFPIYKKELIKSQSFLASLQKCHTSRRKAGSMKENWASNFKNVSQSGSGPGISVDDDSNIFSSTDFDYRFEIYSCQHNSDSQAPLHNNQEPCKQSTSYSLANILLPGITVNILKEYIETSKIKRSPAVIGVSSLLHDDELKRSRNNIDKSSEIIKQNEFILSSEETTSSGGIGGSSGEGNASSETYSYHRPEYDYGNDEDDDEDIFITEFPISRYENQSYWLDKQKEKQIVEPKRSPFFCWFQCKRRREKITKYLSVETQTFWNDTCNDEQLSKLKFSEKSYEDQIRKIQELYELPYIDHEESYSENWFVTPSQEFCWIERAEIASSEKVSSVLARRSPLEAIEARNRMQIFRTEPRSFYREAELIRGPANGRNWRRRLFSLCSCCLPMIQ